MNNGLVYAYAHRELDAKHTTVDLFAHFFFPNKQEQYFLKGEIDLIYIQDSSFVIEYWSKNKYMTYLVFRFNKFNARSNGKYCTLNDCRIIWKELRKNKFYEISCDEVPETLGIR